MAVNYDDKRFKQVEADKKAAINESNKLYDDMVNKSDKYYQAQINASKDWAEKQSDLQQQQTDFAIEKIEQQKEQAEKDYKKEQSGAYVDWQKESNKYGVNAEKTATTGLENSGFSESSQVSMYNTYQNRVATAREGFELAVVNFGNAIKDAQLQNNSALAQIAYESMQQQLELSLQGFQFKNQLLLEKANKKTELENVYHSRWQEVLDQINTENALAEEKRQFNASLAEERRQHNASLAEQRRQFNQKQQSGGGTAKMKDTITEEEYEKTMAKIPKEMLQSIGMNRTKEGSANTIQRYLENGTITEMQANCLLKYFGIE